MKILKKKFASYRRWLLLMPVLVIFGSAPGAAGNLPDLGVAVWITHPATVEGIGSLEEFLLDRLGSNGIYPVTNGPRVKAAAAYVGLHDLGGFDKHKMAELGRVLNSRWVLWVKVADRGVDTKKGLSIPHLFTRRKVVSRMLVDARLIDAATGELLSSRRWKLDKSGAGSYQVAEDVAQDPYYNNSVPDLYRDGQRLEWDAAREISLWFKWATRNQPAESIEKAQTSLLGPGPFAADRDAAGH